jgi:hypothetical protein
MPQTQPTGRTPTPTFPAALRNGSSFEPNGNPNRIVNSKQAADDDSSITKVVIPRFPKPLLIFCNNPLDSGALSAKL